ncbi:MAG: hypothetical protein ACKOW9_03020 [Candidatus Paceibacterota bacterium]
MEELIQEVNALLAFLEPEFTEEDIKVNISNCHMGTDHSHLYPNSYSPSPDLLNIKEVTLGTLRFTNQLDLKDHLPITNINQILDSMVDQELSLAIGELKSLKNIQPLDNDIEKINNGLTDISKLESLAYEYVDFENDTFNALSECHSYHSTNKYASVHNEEATRVVADLKKIRELTLGSPEAKALLIKEAERILNQPLSETEHFVVAGSIEMRNRDQEPKDSHILQPLWLAFNDTDGLYQYQQVILPQWVALTLGKIQPTLLASSLYPKDITESKEFQIAKVLYSDGGLYNNFDEALRAARSI